MASLVETCAWMVALAVFTVQVEALHIAVTIRVAW